MAGRREDGDRGGDARDAEKADRRDGWGSVLGVPIWIGLFMGSWWGVDRLLALAAGALDRFPALRGGARAIAHAQTREVIAPILGLLFGSSAIVLFGALQRRWRGEPSPCERPERAPRRRSGVPKALRDASAVAQIERELDRAERAERGAFRRAALAVNNRLMLSALRRRGYNDDIGCLGIIFILVAATVALPFAAAGAGRLVGFDLDGPLAVLLWFGLAYGGFCIRWVWKKRQAEAVAPHDTRG